MARPRGFASMAAWEPDDGFVMNHLTTAGDASKMPTFVRGELMESSIDLRNVAPGETIELPYELTVNGALRELWTTAFHTTNRLVTSRVYSQRLGFEDQILPFDLMFFLASSMSHAAAATVDVGYADARYYSAAYAGDTFRKSFLIKSRRISVLRPDRCVMTFECIMRNQRGDVVFSVDKTMLFPVAAGERAPDFALEETDLSRRPPPQALREQIMRWAEDVGDDSRGSLRQLTPGRLIVHSASRPITTTQTMQLASIGRIVHDRHFNAPRFSSDAAEKRLYVPGALGVALAHSLAGRELHEMLFQTLHSASFTAPLHPGDVVSAVTFVRARADYAAADLEKLEVVTLGLVGVADARALAEAPLPAALFLGDAPLRARDVRAILDRHPCGLRPDQVILQTKRSIYRQAPRAEPFLL